LQAKIGTNHLAQSLHRGSPGKMGCHDFSLENSPAYANFQHDQMLLDEVRFGLVEGEVKNSSWIASCGDSI
jgi:hypothetical protein